MIALIAIANFIIALFNLYLAWKLQKWRRAIAYFADTLACTESSARNILSRAPNSILKGQQESRALKEFYREWQRQWQQLAQLLALLRFLAVLTSKQWQLPKRLGSSKATPPRFVPVPFSDSASEK